MPLRSTRNLFVDVCEAADTKCLTVIPVGFGERLSGIRATMGAISLPSVGGAAAFLGPYGLLEYNCYWIYVPQTVIATFSAGADEGRVGGVPAPPTSQDDWDTLFRRLMFEFGTDGSQFYGGNPDGAGATYDTLKNMWVREKGAAADSLSTKDDTLADQGESEEPLVSYGPFGIQRLASREQILSPSSVASIKKSLTGVVGATAAIFGGSFDLQDLVFEDQWEETIAANVVGPGAVLCGVVRYEVASTPGHSPTYIPDSDADTASEWARNRALNAFYGGDIQRIQKLISDFTSVEADFLRGLLFAGDNNLRTSQNLLPDGLQGFDASSSSETWYRKNDIMFFGKTFQGHETPYRMGTN